MLTSNEKEILLNRILFGKTFFNFNNDRYILLSPSIEIKYEAALVYDTIINEEKFYDWIREDNAENIMIGLGLWNLDTNKNLKALEQKLDNLKVELFVNFMIPSKTKNIRSNIKNTKNSINKIYSTKQNFITNTLEGYANSIKHEYIICNTLYNTANKLVFDTNKNNKSFSLFNNLIQEIDQIMITTEHFKEIARDGLWRNYWNTSDKTKLFSGSSIELTDEQRALINISKMYDNVYEHPECPSESVIVDDDALEGWMIMQKRKNEVAKKQNAFDATNNQNMKKAGEVFMMADSKDDVAAIVEMNTYEGKAILQEKLSYIDKVGSVNDGELPDVQRSIQQQIDNLKKANKGK